ncbi:polysaccharide deacetylase family protein [Patulibacter brassicae]|uniref:Polysaccharide deacetylase family protein n=1 Tax=Patulibacter brassicae TaxID=1705717 RepID=A0ABU4VN16_9ACTN|nr:polysaccharide deacetylase family protein [Patulibacter brassicae]MDX8153014.1 polysaccharide deacetylase family protein [Patulibacter brassicae]
MPAPRHHPPAAGSRSLLPAIAVVAVALAVAMALLLTRGDDAPAPPARATTTTAGSPSAGRAPARRPATVAARRARERAAWPRRGAVARRTRVPILMYHLIAAAPAGTPYPELWVPAARFREQVDALAAAGFTAVTLSEAWDAWHGDGRLPRHPVVLSFDDGSLSQVMAAGPALRRHGWPGVLNLTLDHLNAKGMPRWGARRLLREGWEIDSHTLTHPDLTTLGPDALREELAGSRRRLRERLGVETRFLCYPAGRNDATVRAAAKAAGYVAATTVQPGIAGRGDDPFLLPRIRVEPGTTGAALVRMARGEASAPPPGAAGATAAG